MLKRGCEARGLDHGDWLNDLKRQGKWHVEVY
jgi:hypothetical protein